MQLRSLFHITVLISAIFNLADSTILCKDSEEKPIVETNYGKIRGYKEDGVNGRSYFAFKSIPYAKPPIGNLRFEAPKKPESWDGILDAQTDPPACMQKNYLFGHKSAEGKEDCLYLNVYTSKLQVNRNALLPVMVFIHWGGFFTGYSSSAYLGPDYILEKSDVVLVTFNYRLGVLGFLSTNDDNAPGNYGLKDQLAVLKWVQENIHNFGGNKSRVTIFGQSAGGASVHFHILSPQSKNLFQNAISQSGTALALWAKPLGIFQKTITIIQAQFIRCQTDNMTAMIECLRKVPAEELVESGDIFKTFSIDPLNIYLPSIEIQSDKNPDPFITKQPIEYIRSKEFSSVPWIIGNVQDEGRIRAEPIIRQTKTRLALNKNFDKLMPDLLQLKLSTRRMTKVWEKIKKFYFQGKNSIDIEDATTIKALTDLYTDRAFSYTTYQTALFHRMQGHKNIWFYNFNYTGEMSYGQLFSSPEEDIFYQWGAAHCDDLVYLFKSPALFNDQLENPKDVNMKNFLTEVFVNFAENGNPNRNTSKPIWDKISIDNGNFSKDLKYLDIEGSYKEYESPHLQMKDGLHRERFSFWERLPLVENIPELFQIHTDL